MVIRPYVLAGGQSSRMGRDKASMSLAGQTMLSRAVNTLRQVHALQGSDGRVVVTILGQREQLDGADRMIADRFPGCGPLGGMEAALEDLERTRDAEWAFFMPVDMPLLSATVINPLLREWEGAVADGARICHVVVDGRPLPLVSLVHRTVRPFLVEALTAGQFKVTQVLQSAGHALALSHTDGLGSCLHRTQGGNDLPAASEMGAVWAAEHEYLNRIWFSNLNTEEEFSEAETFIAAMGSS